MNAQPPAQFLKPKALADVGRSRVNVLRLKQLWLGLRPSIALPSTILLLALACAVFPGLIAPFHPTDMDRAAILQAPNAAHLLGTDQFGRDILSLLIYGARQTLLVGVGAVSLGIVLGGAIGLASGYAGGAVDLALMRLLEIWTSVPDLLLMIVIASVLRPSLPNMILIIGVVLTPRYARVMRSQVMAVKHRSFVAAAHALGASHASIVRRHILPHCLSPMLVMATLGLAGSILIGATLSFIGLSVVDDRPDWGFLLSQARGYLTVAWWFGLFPGLAITALVISVSLLGDQLRQRFDPRAKGR